ncbi:MAG: hypothetical protein IJS94_09110 [Clostridia bacterium]|nr:hypothetical protein [Clostridia bacterium]
MDDIALFCEEPVTAVYNGSRKYDDYKDTNAFFDCYHDLAYHVTPGYRIVLETERYFISLGASGVSLSDKTCGIKDFEEQGEWLDPFIHEDGEENGPHRVDYESTLFVGERLNRVEKLDGFYVLFFDHFQLKLIPHETDKDDVPTLWKMDHWSYNHVYGCERLLKKKCECGGCGELLLDFVYDYVVRCSKCNKSTRASMNSIDAIEDWNAGELQCDLSNITIE